MAVHAFAMRAGNEKRTLLFHVETRRENGDNDIVAKLANTRRISSLEESRVSFPRKFGNL